MRKLFAMDHNNSSYQKGKPRLILQLPISFSSGKLLPAGREFLARLADGQDIPEAPPQQRILFSESVVQ